jgi:hypothetical protein
MILCQAPSATVWAERAMYVVGEPVPATTHWARPLVAPTCIFHWLPVPATPFCMMFAEPRSCALVSDTRADQRNSRVPGLRSASSAASSRPRGQVVAPATQAAGNVTYWPSKRTTP